MMMIMTVMMMAITPRMEARLLPLCLTHIVHARRLRTKPGQAADARAKTGEAATSRSRRCSCVREN